MLLAIDVGNTNLHFGVFQGETLVSDWRVSTNRERTADEHGALLRELLASEGLRLDQLSGAAVSNVVPPLAPALRHFVRRYLRREPEFVGEALRVELPIRYQPPQAVGADRLVDALAVLREYSTPAVVVDFGTATTFDAISREGEYLGGAIAPGIGISLDALFRTAAHLPRFELVRPASVIGGTTVESMQSGAFFGFVGQVEGMVRRLKGELGDDTRVIATGGLAELLGQEAGCFDHIDPLLTLKGLRLAWEDNHRDVAGRESEI